MQQESLLLVFLAAFMLLLFAVLVLARTPLPARKKADRGRKTRITSRFVSRPRPVQSPTPRDLGSNPEPSLLPGEDDHPLVDVAETPDLPPDDPENTDDGKIEISVLAPLGVPPGAVFDIKVQVDRPSKDFVEILGDVRRSYETIVTEIKKGGAVGLVLDSNLLQVNVPFQSLYWHEQYSVALFRIIAPERPGKSENIVYIINAGAPIAEIPFTIDIDPSVLHAPADVLQRQATLHESSLIDAVSGLEPVGHGDGAARYRNAFVSYTRADYQAVYHFGEGLEEAGIQIALDNLTFERGPDWMVQAAKYIDECDVFYLCWSANAASSPGVDEELRYAIEERGKRFKANLERRKALGRTATGQVARELKIVQILVGDQWQDPHPLLSRRDWALSNWFKLRVFEGKMQEQRARARS